MTDQPQSSDTPFFSMQGISKRFGAVLANDNIDLEIRRGEVLALLGENGAGKSTLVKILYGFYRSDAGKILKDGIPITVDSPQEAREAKIGMVFQQFNLIPAFTVAENVALFDPDLPAMVDLNTVGKRIEELSQRYKLTLNPRELVSDLSIGDSQKIEIIKLLISDARLLIFDEPTRVLAPHEIDALFEIMNTLRADGYAIILITHKLKEVLRIADRVAVLRDGALSGSLEIEDATEEKLVELMFGQRLTAFAVAGKTNVGDAAEALLELRDLGTTAEGTEVSLSGIHLTLRSGELVGVAGVSGEGQRQLADVVLGRIKATSGEKLLRGIDATNYSIRKMRDNGMVFIPESPLQMAAAPFMSVLENLAIPEIDRYARRGGLVMDWEAVQNDYRASMERLGFEVPLYALARALSGGNLQRSVVMRELAHQPALIIASYITSGLDVQSAIAAREALLRACRDGAGVLLFSEDLEELFSLCDRLIVLHGGQIKGEFKPCETSFQEVGYLMTGTEAEHVR